MRVALLPQPGGAPTGFAPYFTAMFTRRATVELLRVRRTPFANSHVSRRALSLLLCLPHRLLWLSSAAASAELCVCIRAQMGRDLLEAECRLRGADEALWARPFPIHLGTVDRSLTGV